MSTSKQCSGRRGSLLSTDAHFQLLHCSIDRLCQQLAVDTHRHPKTFITPTVMLY